MSAFLRRCVPSAVTIAAAWLCLTVSGCQNTSIELGPDLAPEQPDLLADMRLADMTPVDAMPDAAPLKGWIKTASGTGIDLISLHGSGSSDVWAVGGLGLAAGDRFVISHFDGTRWRADEQQGRTLDSVFVAGPKDVWAGGAFGFLWRWNGVTWTLQSPGAAIHLDSIWGSRPDDVSIIGGDSLIHWDGKTFTRSQIDPPGKQQYTNSALWGFGAGDIWASTSFQAYHYDGTSWARRGTPDPTRYLVSIWGSGPTNIWVVGLKGLIGRFDGTGWTTVPSGTTESLQGVWGSNADDVWFVGTEGTILHYSKGVLSPVPSGTKEALRNVWGTDADNVWIAGSRGTILRWYP